MTRPIAGIACALLLSGCALPAVISGDTSQCSTANRQLAQARAYAIVLQIAITTAEAAGNIPAVAAAQAALNLVNQDITAFQNLVTSACASPTPGPTAHTLLGGPVITSSDAATRIARDKHLAEAFKAN
jgi:hypothetical protein